jgi:hypothetical protein
MTTGRDLEFRGSDDADFAGRTTVSSQPTTTTTESAIPMELVVLPALIGAVVWISTVLLRFAI